MRRFFVGFCILLFAFLLEGMFILEAHAQTETQRFFVEQAYDLLGRKEIEAQLVREDSKLYFYVENSWWDSRSAREQNDLRIALAELGLEFQNKIYPVLTSTFGQEPKPGIDNNEKITVLAHPMASEVGGYFLLDDVYEKLQSPASNEREMVYLNSQYIGTREAKSFLAHEFVHLITAQQKALGRRVSEETWLDEARAEYAPTLLGYDDIYRGSNLERRVEGFLEEPSDSLIEWPNKTEDYGVVNMFIQYLVDHYGVKTLVDSLQSSQTGIPSLQEALQKNGFQKDFVQIFSDWAIAVLVNDCSIGKRYCYKNSHLRNVRITPTFYYIPRAETVFSTYHTTPYWSASWHRLVGGEQNLTLEFEGSDSGDFEVPYVLCDSKDNCSVDSFSLDEEQKGEISFSEFDTAYSSLTLVPFVRSTSNDLNRGDSLPFSWQVTVQKDEGGDAALISQLLARIAELQEQVRQLQAQLAILRAQGGPPAGGFVSCVRFDQNLSFGMRNGQIRCLQEFLRAQGPDIYPEGLVTGNFLSLTRQAVVRLQEKYASEILAPLGLNGGTGYVGPMTRNKINQLLSFLVVL